MDRSGRILEGDRYEEAAREMIDVEIVEVDRQPTAVVRGRVAVADLPEFFGGAFHAVFAALEAQGVAPAGVPFGYYPSMPGDVVVVEAGVAVGPGFEPSGDVVASELPGGRVAVAIHVGPYEELERTYAAVLEQLGEQGWRPGSRGVWEEYLTAPDAGIDPAEWRTKLVIPVE